MQGDHHFYISFKTRYPGVLISERLAEKFPEEITVVLQHQFWDLIVTEMGFEVGMSFGGAPEKLVVPFEAITGFFDPSVQFGLKFEVMVEGEASQESSVRSDEDEGSEYGEPEHDNGNVGNPSNPSGLKVVPDAGGMEMPPKGEKIISLDTFRKKK